MAASLKNSTRLAVLVLVAFPAVDGRASDRLPDNPIVSLTVQAPISDLTTGNRLSRTWVDRMVQHSLDSSDVPAFAVLAATESTGIGVSGEATMRNRSIASSR